MVKTFENSLGYINSGSAWVKLIPVNCMSKFWLLSEKKRIFQLIADIRDLQVLQVAENMGWNSTDSPHSPDTVQNLTDNWNYITHIQALYVGSRSQYTAVLRKVVQQNRTRQCRKLLWVMGVYGIWLRL